MAILITGAAGFIGFHTAARLLERGESVIGVDTLNDYYDVNLKKARLERLMSQPGFTFHQIDIADRAAMEELVKAHPDVTGVVSLAAQPGVRYSLIDPYAYTHANVDGHLVLLEMCRRWEGLTHLVYASSSSVYGMRDDDAPFSLDDRTDAPVSLYAATKKAAELMSHTYSHLYRIPATGLRFFTVYGPWGRPDMAAYGFVDKVWRGEPIEVYNNGEMQRDFTYIDDIVWGVIASLDTPPKDTGEGAPPHRLYNIGNHKTEKLMRFIEVIEEAVGKKAVIDFKPMQKGDVKQTYADISVIQSDLGFNPSTSIDVGIPKFVEWYKGFHS